MSAAGERYRVVLRLLPAWYRARWEEEMVSAHLDKATARDAGRDEGPAGEGWPAPGEVASVWALALRLRLGGPGAPPRSQVYGHAVRAVALVGLLAGAAWLPWSLAQFGWIAAGLPLPAATQAAMAASPPNQEWMSTALLGAVWLAAYLALLAGRRRQATVLACLPLLVAAVSTSLAVASGGEHPARLATAWALLLADVFVVAALAAHHAWAPPTPKRPWLLALGLVFVLAPAPAVLVLAQPVEQAPWLDWAGLQCLVWLGAALVLALRPITTTAATLALVLLAVPVLLLRLATTADYALGGMPLTTPVALGVLEAVAVAAAAVPLLARVRRRLPPETPPTHPPSPARSYPSPETPGPTSA